MQWDVACTEAAVGGACATEVRIDLWEAAGDGEAMRTPADTVAARSPEDVKDILRMTI